MTKDDEAVMKAAMLEKRAYIINWASAKQATRLFAMMFAISMTGTIESSAQAPSTKAQDAAAALVRGNASEAVTGYTDALRDQGLANDRRATLLTDRAVAYAKTGQSKLALDDYNRALQLFPEYPPAYNNRASLLLSLGYPAEALKDLDRAILLSPGYAPAFANRATASFQLGRLKDAIQDYTKAIELQPASASSLAGRGVTLLASGLPHAAVRDLSRAVNVDTRFASAYRNRAEAKIAIGQIEDAVEDYSRAIAFDAANAELYALRGEAYLDSDNTSAALKDFDRAIEIDPKLARGYAGRGLARGLAGEFDSAFEDLNKSIELAPRVARAFAFRALVYKESGQADIGMRDIETAAKLGLQHPEVLWAKAEVEDALGQTDAAVADLRKALAVRPSYARALESLERLGVKPLDGEDRPVADAGLDPWRVVLRGAMYFAVNDELPQLRVPLEMAGSGAPRILQWVQQPPPHKSYGVLRFFGGLVNGTAGVEEVELAAILDLDRALVIGIEPQRQGSKTAIWTWEDGRVSVASVDGVTDEFILRAARPYEATQRRNVTVVESAADWDQWGSVPAGPPQDQPKQRRQARYKPKTLMQLLFGN